MNRTFGWVKPRPTSWHGCETITAMDKDLATQVSELRDLLTEYQDGTNRVLMGLIKSGEGMNALDDYRGQQIAKLERRCDALAALARAEHADPVDVAESFLRAVDDE